jgi:uncharacterized membrane protein YraQ (UPF0718 family)
VDSIAVTYALLGPVFAVFRPLVALVTGVLGGSLVQLLDTTDDAPAPEETLTNTCNDACCEKGPGRGAVLQALKYGFVTLPRDIGWALFAGILVAGAIAALVPEDSLEAYIGGGMLSILLMMAAGIPIYVCATASVPIAAGLIHLGASPGAALAFLIAGPATNAAALTTAWKVLGRRAALVYLLTVAGSAFGCAILLDWLIPTLGAAMPQFGTPTDGHAQGAWLSNLGAVAMLAVLTLSYAGWHKKGTRDGC